MPIYSAASGRGPLFLASPPIRSLVPMTGYVPPPPAPDTFVLMEDDFFVLMEDGSSKVILDA